MQGNLAAFIKRAKDHIFAAYNIIMFVYAIDTGRKMEYNSMVFVR